MKMETIGTNGGTSNGTLKDKIGKYIKGSTMGIVGHKMGQMMEHKIYKFWDKIRNWKGTKIWQNDGTGNGT